MMQFEIIEVDCLRNIAIESQFYWPISHFIRQVHQGKTHPKLKLWTQYFPWKMEGEKNTPKTHLVYWSFQSAPDAVCLVEFRFANIYGLPHLVCSRPEGRLAIDCLNDPGVRCLGHSGHTGCGSAAPGDIHLSVPPTTQRATGQSGLTWPDT